MGNGESGMANGRTGPAGGISDSRRPAQMAEWKDSRPGGPGRLSTISNFSNAERYFASHHQRDSGAFVDLTVAIASPVRMAAR